MTTLKIGDRVALLADFGDYPMPFTPAGSTGKITQITPEFVGVLMDQEFPHLADWENVLQVYTFNDDVGQVPDWSILGAAPAFPVGIEALRQATHRARKINPLIGTSVGGGRFNVVEVRELQGGNSDVTTLARDLTLAETIDYLDGIA